MRKFLIFYIFVTAISGCSNEPKVDVENQTLIGKYHQNTDIAAFLGIPFAEPPVDELRWSAPVHYQAKNSVRHVKNFSPACVQPMGILEWYRDLAEVFGNPRDIVGDLSINEDCLYLNVWTPTLDNTADLPVMVYIHGGSNNSGWSFEPNYHGYALAKKDVVVVSIAYRLGVFGFFSHPEIQGSINANFGLWDQVLALEWIKKNIKKFGGNPNNVTAFGESAGAQDILALMFADPAKNLFHKAILQSNAGFGLPQQTNGNGHVRSSMEDERNRGLKLAKILSSSDTPLSLDELKSVTADKILNAYQREFSEHYHSPAVDGYLIKRPTWLDIQNKDLSNMRVIIGTNADEYYANTPENVTPEMLEIIANQLFSSMTDGVMNTFKSETDPRNIIDRLYTAEGMLCPSENLAANITSDKGKSWVYYFDRIREGNSAKHPMVRAYHGAELPYVFNTHDEWMTTTNLDNEITDIITDYWTNFAKNDNPNNSNISHWPEFKKDTKFVQRLGDKIETIPSTESVLCSIYTNQITQ